MIKLYTKDNIKKLNIPNTKEAHFVYNYIYPFISNRSQKFISNVKTECMLLQIDNILLPVTKNDAEYENSYVCSPYTHYIIYLQEEMKMMGMNFLCFLLYPVFLIISSLSKASKINKVIIINNYMLSTNLYPPISKMSYCKILDFFKTNFPNHLIMFRSLNSDFNNQEINFLEQLRFSKLASRRVYLLRQENFKAIHRKTLNKDRDLAKKEKYYFEKASSNDEDLKNISKFYNELYIDKYSHLNPQFNMEFYKNILKHELFDIQILKKNYTSLGVYGIFTKDKTSTAPIFGYDMSYPKKYGLYRVLALWGANKLEKENCFINRSSGVANFKRNRGAFASTEYSLIYFFHLSLFRRVYWKCLCLFVNKIVLPVLIKKKF